MAEWTKTAPSTSVMAAGVEHRAQSRPSVGTTSKLLPRNISGSYEIEKNLFCVKLSTKGP